jgi:hypothetical protein
MAKDPASRYRSAHLAGSEGRQLSPSSRGLADADPLIDQAHDAGRNQAPFGDFLAQHPELTPAPAPAAPSAPAPSAPSAPRPLQAAASKLSGGRTESLGAVLLGVLLATLALSVLDYGAKGPLYWFEAKFLNDAVAGPSASSSKTPTAVSQGPLGPLAGFPGVPSSLNLSGPQTYEPNADTGAG